MSLSTHLPHSSRSCGTDRLLAASMVMFPMTAGQFDTVYNFTSLTLASMMASTLFFWIRIGSVNEKYKSAMTIT